MKYKLTLFNDQVIELHENQVHEVSKSMGDLQGIDLRRCYDEELCPSCIQKGRIKPCYQPYYNRYVRGPEEPIFVTATFPVKEIEKIL